MAGTTLDWIRPIAAVLLFSAAAALVQQALGAPLPALGGLAFVLLAAWTGWAFRQAWMAPARLRRAEALWDEGQTPAAVLRALSGTETARGEVGYRAGLLKSRAALALEDREGAWRHGLEASLLRLPFWHRWPLLRFLRHTRTAEGAEVLIRGEALLRRFPHLARLHHLVALLHFQARQPARAWELLASAVPDAAEDPALLEDLLLTSLHHLQRGTPLENPRIPEIFEAALSRLLARHGDPRLCWDRTAPARYLLDQGRCERVLALAQSLPDDLRPPELWLQEIRALQDLGDIEGAMAAVLNALARHPHSVGLWLERHALALEMRRVEEGILALEEAGRLLKDAPEDDPHRGAWRMRLAEFTYWNRGDAAGAWEILQTVPVAEQMEGQPPLMLELLMALGRFEEAYEGVVEALKARPDDVDLLLLQADCLAGMQAWEALLPFLESQKDDVKTRGDYWNLLGLTLTHLGQKLSARDHLERAAFMEPDHVDFILDAAHACMDLAEHDRAAHHLRQVLRLDSRNADALVQLAETRRLAHDREGARRYLRECLLHHPDHPQAQEYLAELEAN